MHNTPIQAIIWFCFCIIHVMICGKEEMDLSYIESNITWSFSLSDKIMPSYVLFMCYFMEIVDFA